MGLSSGDFKLAEMVPGKWKTTTHKPSKKIITVRLFLLLAHSALRLQPVLKPNGFRKKIVLSLFPQKDCESFNLPL